MDEATKFRKSVLKVAQSQMEFNTKYGVLKEIGFEIEITDISIDKRIFAFEDDEVKERLVPVAPEDIDPDKPLIIEPIIKVKDWTVNAPIYLNLTEDVDITLIASKAEISTISEEEETNFTKVGPIMQRVLDALILKIVVNAIIFAIKLVLGLLI